MVRVYSFSRPWIIGSAGPSNLAAVYAQGGLPLPPRFSGHRADSFEQEDDLVWQRVEKFGRSPESRIGLDHEQPLCQLGSGSSGHTNSPCLRELLNLYLQFLRTR